VCNLSLRSWSWRESQPQYFAFWEVWQWFLPRALSDFRGTGRCIGASHVEQLKDIEVVLPGKPCAPKFRELITVSERFFLVCRMRIADIRSLF
jgi:hypothetical protein